MPTPDPVPRRKHADLAGGVGAGLIGAGLAWLLPAPARPPALALIVLGVLLHGWGMLEKRRLDAGITVPRWSSVLYWSCWAVLAALSAWIALKAVG